jgi:precorrin-2/cobalt-factor-2 C20-methyltransferase
MSEQASGRCVGVGVGPGDPELVTLRAVRAIREAPVIAWFSAVKRQSNARRIVAAHLHDGHEELHLEYPVTTEALPAGVSYESLLIDFYDESAKRIAEQLDGGRDVAVLCEGDPFFFGSFMYLHNRLKERYEVEVVPGVASMLGAAARVDLPLVCRNEALVVLSGVLAGDELERRLADADVAIVMKLGRNFVKVRQAVERAGLLERAFYVERATMAEEVVRPLAEVDAEARAPYFSMVVVPSATASTR